VESLGFDSSQNSANEVQQYLLSLEDRTMRRLVFPGQPYYEPQKIARYWLVQISNGVYQSIWIEDSTRKHVFSTEDFDELMYVIVGEIVKHLAAKWNRKYGDHSVSSRVEKELELMTLISPDWAWRHLVDVAKSRKQSSDDSVNLTDNL